MLQDLYVQPEVIEQQVGQVHAEAVLITIRITRYRLSSGKV